MKAICLVNSKSVIGGVYAPELLAEMKEEFGELPVLSAGELEERAAELADTEYIFSTWSMPCLQEEEFARFFPALKAVFYAAGSVQGFARQVLHLGASVFSAWGANGVPVAEYTVAQIILANKGFFQNQLYCKTDRGACGPITVGHHGNYGCRVGLIGCGMIGSMVAERLKAYNLKVVAYDPFMSEEKAKALGVEKVDDLMDLFSACAVVSNHLANNAATRGMIQYRHFAAMEKYGTFINTGRGAQIVEDDMIRALTERPTLTAVLDVTDPEPPKPESPLLTLPNVILTSHIAGSQQDEFHRMSEYMWEEYKRFKAGEPTRWGVTEKMLETMA